MACFARALSQDDEPALLAIDQAHIVQFGGEVLIQRSSLSFFERTGHAFTAFNDDQVVGFVFAQAIFNGTRPTIFVSRLAVHHEDVDVVKQALELLVEAVTKSAYDAAVYDLMWHVPASDEKLQRTLAKNQYDKCETHVFERVLGSRGQSR
ncbi:MAG: DUF1999 family protein [Deinococcota bacterium]